MLWEAMRLCVVTDIHGFPAPAECLSSSLQSSPDVVRFALNDLCGQPELSGEALHQHLFTEDGISEVVRTLRYELKGDLFGLGYSAGGTAIWRAAKAGLQFRGIFCVSSTRLREESSISMPNHVFFGSEDNNRPSAEWLSTVPFRQTVFPGAEHTYYLQPDSDASGETRMKIEDNMQNLSKMDKG